jgi:hypothetical protein
MNRVVKILMNRDNIDQETAEALVRETRDEIISLDENDIFGADNIIAEYLGLEPDYIFDILDF